jgi:lipoic acid synthetase
MVGLGEEFSEVTTVLQDLRSAGCDCLTIGQYLQPTPHHLPVSRFITPEEFAAYKEIAIQTGFVHVESGPFVRSSYRAHELWNTVASGRNWELSPTYLNLV